MTGRQPHTTRGRRISRSVAAGLLVAGLALGLPPVSASAAPTDGWTAPYGDQGNAATNPGETAITAATASRLGAAWATGRTIGSTSAFAPAVVNGTALRVVTSTDVNNPVYLGSTSPSTGATTSLVPLPRDAQYNSGLTVSGSLVLIPFNGFQRPGGVLAVDLGTKKVVWSRNLPASSIPWAGNDQAGQPYTDGQRVFVSGSSNVVNAYRLSDGGLVWTAPVTFNSQGTTNGWRGMAVGNGAVFTAGDEGLIAYDAATGRRLWTGQGDGAFQPVVAGGRVFMAGYGVVRAFPAAGCGKTTCSPTWTATFPQLSPNTLEIGGADASTLFVTYYGDNAGTVTRLSATTGARQWSAPVDRAALGLVRAGNTIWMNSEYIAPSGAVGQQIVGFSTTATGATPLRKIPLPAQLSGFPQTLGVAAGTLFQQPNSGFLAGYRVAAGTPVNAAPVASFTTSVSGLSVEVDGSGSRDPDGLVTTYDFDFGDGGTSWGDSAVWTYAKAGTYRITLEVTDWSGASTTTTKTVTVGAPVTPAPTSGAFATDTFRRTVTGGLGTADVGGAWSSSAGASRQSVANGTATLALAPGASTGGYLGGTSQPGADLTATVSLNGAAPGSGAYYDLIGRRTGADRQYQLQTRFLADGTVRLTVMVVDGTERAVGAETVVSGLRYTPGTALHLRFRVSGTGTTSLQAKAWVGSAEPSAWTVTRTDATASVQGRGQVGMSAYLSGSAATRSLVFAVTQFQARPVG